MTVTFLHICAQNPLWWLALLFAGIAIAAVIVLSVVFKDRLNAFLKGEKYKPKNKKRKKNKKAKKTVAAPDTDAPQKPVKVAMHRADGMRVPTFIIPDCVPDAKPVSMSAAKIDAAVREAKTLPKEEAAAVRETNAPVEYPTYDIDRLSGDTPSASKKAVKEPPLPEQTKTVILPAAPPEPSEAKPPLKRAQAGTIAKTGLATQAEQPKKPAAQNATAPKQVHTQLRPSAQQTAAAKTAQATQREQKTSPQKAAAKTVQSNQVQKTALQNAGESKSAQPIRAKRPQPSDSKPVSAPRSRLQK